MQRNTNQTFETSKPGHSAARRVATVVAVTTITAAGLAGCTSTSLGPGEQANGTVTTPEAPQDATQRSLAELGTADNGYYPAVLAAVTDAEGGARDYTVGTGDLETEADVPIDGEVRIGSNTKTYTAVTLLQLVGEDRVDLDAPIETYLPGLVRGQGIDGRNITARQLLNHTSGLPNYTFFLADGLLPYVHSYKSPRELLDLGLSQPATFAPGAQFEYSNTNYLVAGLIIEAVTDRPVAEQITARLIEPLGLEHTYFPEVGEQTLRGPHPHAYHNDDPAAPLTDVTEQDPSFGWAAGQMVSTPSEVNEFFTALLDGELLKPEEMEQMRTTVPAEGLGEGVGYGLGLISTPLSCGGVSWGHGGSITGTNTTNAATDDGRAVTIATTRLPADAEQISVVQAAVDSELCR